MDDGFSVEVIEVGEDARLEFFLGCDANAAEHGQRHFGKEAFDEMSQEPSVIPSFCGLRRGVRKESGRAETLWKRILVVLAGFVCCFLAERDSPS